MNGTSVVFRRCARLSCTDVFRPRMKWQRFCSAQCAGYVNGGREPVRSEAECASATEADRSAQRGDGANGAVPRQGQTPKSHSRLSSRGRG